MRAQEFTPVVQEYEQGTPSARKIQRTLTGAGYRRLGGGVESAVWGKSGVEQGRPVFKIIMPGLGSSTDLAMKSFLRFYRLTKQRASPHWPVWIPQTDEAGRESDYAVFWIDGEKYVQISMERLAELSPGESLIIEDMADSLAQGHSLKKWVFRNMDEARERFPQDIQALEPQLSSLWAAMQVAYRKTGGDYVWDLHGGNAMKRRDGTIVITDPFIRWDQ
jgi:hypothetical protein